MCAKYSHRVDSNVFLGHRRHFGLSGLVSFSGMSVSSK
jgi:hypothetical protein